MIDVIWNNLKSVSEDTLYRKECAFCEDGVFLVLRDRETFELEEYDNCISCGQTIRYIDIEKMRNMDHGRGYK